MSRVAIRRMLSFEPGRRFNHLRSHTARLFMAFQRKEPPFIKSEMRSRYYLLSAR